MNDPAPDLGTSSIQPPAASESPAAQPLSDAEVHAISEVLAKRNTHNSGSGWFYWIAGLSLVNSVVAWSGNNWSFLAGLGITQVVDAISATLAKDGGGLTTFARAFAILFDLAVAAGFVCLGRFSRGRHLGAYATGLTLYAIDALILLAFQEWFGFAFHLWALYGIWNGFQACRWLERLEAMNARSPEGSSAEPA